MAKDINEGQTGQREKKQLRDYAEKRARLKAENDYEGLQKSFPRNASPTRLRIDVKLLGDQEVI